MGSQPLGALVQFAVNYAEKIFSAFETEEARLSIDPLPFSRRSFRKIFNLSNGTNGRTFRVIVRNAGSTRCTPKRERVGNKSAPPTGLEVGGEISTRRGIEMFFNRPAPIYTGNRRTKVLRPGKRILEVVVESRKHSGGPLYLHSLTRYERCVDALLTTCACRKKTQHYISNSI